MMETVQCKFCVFVNQNRCTKKKAKVKPNKKRTCKIYKANEMAVRASEEKAANKPKVMTQSPWMKAGQSKAGGSERLLTGDPKHPLTGDLSRFVKSTVSDK
jgi:hypothetical protein